MGKIFGDYSIGDAEIALRLEKLRSRVVEGQERQTACRTILGFLDMTTLEGSDTEDRVIGLCEKARFSRLSASYPDAAAVCVYPSLVRHARKALDGCKVKVASVAGGFPAGQTSLAVKLAEVRWAIEEGADEIDAVISRGKLLENRENEVYDELAAIRETCGAAQLKVILETGELETSAWIRKASVLAIGAGADFIKTSTGKISVGATPEAFLTMLDTIREFHEKTGKAIGIKPAGGIRTTDQALLYYTMVMEILGDDWLCSDFFRIGASSLADAILKEIAV